MKTKCPKCGVELTLDSRIPNKSCYNCGEKVNFYVELSRPENAHQRAWFTPRCPKCGVYGQVNGHRNLLFKTLITYKCPYCHHEWAQY